MKPAKAPLPCTHIMLIALFNNVLCAQKKVTDHSEKLVSSGSLGIHLLYHTSAGKKIRHKVIAMK